METKPYTTSLKNVATREDIEVLIAEISRLLSSTYSSEKDSFLGTLKEDIGALCAENISEVMKDRGISPNSMKEVREFLNKFREDLKDVEYIRLVVPFEMSPSFVQEVFEWVKNNVGSSTFLDIERNRELMGGPVVIFRGKYVDMTMKKTFEDNEGELKRIIEGAYSREGGK